MNFVMKYRNVAMLFVLVVALLVSGSFAAIHSFASGSCTGYTIQRGDTLGSIATRFGTTSQSIAQRNGIANINFIYAGQYICVPGSGSGSTSAGSGAIGSYNPFAYPQCTWWADYRYHQIHGVYVPWYNNANAWQWVARAYQYGWRVNSYPQVGDIVVFQPGVQYASGIGHVGVVEAVYSGGRITVSSTNVYGYVYGPYGGFYANPYNVTYYTKYVGYGVSFIHR